jgi:uncharacterized protein
MDQALALGTADLGRRAFLSGLAGSLLVGLGFRAAIARGSAGPLYVGCRADEVERYFATGFRADGQVVFDIALAGRGHGAAFRPAPAQCVVFARRPGTFAVAIDLERGEVVRRIDAAAGRHFYGHGAFASDGRHLFTSENDFAAGRGVIGIRDADDDYRQIGEFASHGIGPHEVALMPDGATLVAANGGIRTHPDNDRAMLNLDTMQPSLAYLDLASGRLQDAFGLAPDLHRLSIRHLAVNGDGVVAVAMQYEGSKRDRVPLVGVHAGGAIRLLDAPPAIERRMRRQHRVRSRRPAARGLLPARQPDHVLGCRDDAPGRSRRGGRRLRGRAGRRARRFRDHRRARRRGEDRSRAGQPGPGDGRRTDRHRLGQSSGPGTPASGRVSLNQRQIFAKIWRHQELKQL